MKATRKQMAERFAVFVSLKGQATPGIFATALIAARAVPVRPRNTLGDLAYMTLVRWVQLGYARRDPSEQTYKPLITVEQFRERLMDRDTVRGDRIAKGIARAAKRQQAMPAAAASVHTSALAPWLRGLV